MTDELPDAENEPTLSSDALEWSFLFEQHYRDAFHESCAELPLNPETKDFQNAAAQAFIATMRDSGVRESELVEFVGQAIWKQTKIQENWTPKKNLRRIALIDKVFQNTITHKEQFELSSLTQIMRAAVDTEENIPTLGAKKLYSELLELDDDE